MTTVSFDVVAMDKASKTFQAITAQMEQLTKRLDKLGQTKATAEVDVDTSKAEGRFSKFGGMLKGGAAAAGLAAGAALAKGLTDALDTQSALKKLDAQIGGSAALSQAAGKAAGKLYAEGYGESMGDVADAIKSVVQNIDGMRDATDLELQAISARAMDTAKVLDEDVGGVTRAVSQMLRTGLAPSAEEAFDVLVRGAQLGVNASGDLLDTFNEYSTQFRSIGLDAKTALGIMQQGLQGGARDADVVADAMKELNIRVSDKSAAKALQDLGLNADSMARAFAEGGPKAFTALDQIMDRLRAVKNPTDQYRLAQQLLGTQSEDLAKALLKIDPSAATQGLGELDGATAKAGLTMADTAQNRITVLWRSIKENLVDFLGNQAIPRIQEFAGSLDFGAVVGRVREIAGNLKGLWDQIVNDVRAWAQTHQSEIRSFVDNARGLFESFRDTANAVISAVTVWWAAHGEQLLTVVTGTLNNIVNIIRSVFDIIRGIFQVVQGLISGDWGKFWEGLKNIASGTMDLLLNAIDGVLRLIVGAFGGSWDKIKTQAAAKWSEIVAEVKKGVNQVLDAWNWVVDHIGLPNLHVGLLSITPVSVGTGRATAATGGILPGYTPGRDVHTFYSPTAGILELSGGEPVLRPEVGRVLGSSWVDGVNAAARTGGTAGVQRYLGGYADGGIFDIGGWVKGMFTNAMGAIPGTGLAKSVITTLVDKVLGALVEKVKGAFTAVFVGGGAGVQRWAPVVLQALAMMGQPSTLLDTVLRRMNQESGGNQYAINLWDSNALRGTPSKGLMQVIDPTFRAYHFPGTSWDIYEPLANILASMKYAIARYGSLSAAYNKPGGYDNGGYLMPGWNLAYNGLGRPEWVDPKGPRSTVERHYHLTVVNANNTEADIRTHFRRMELMAGV